MSYMNFVMGFAHHRVLVNQKKSIGRWRPEVWFLMGTQVFLCPILVYENIFLNFCLAKVWKIREKKGFWRKYLCPLCHEEKLSKEYDWFLSDTILQKFLNRTFNEYIKWIAKNNLSKLIIVAILLHLWVPVQCKKTTCYLSKSKYISHQRW